MKKTRLPKTDSIRKLAEFWDKHDLTDFEDELEEVAVPVFGRMTRQQFDAESDRYDADFAGVSAKRVSNARQHPKKPGRPRKPAGQRAAKVLITMPPQVLAAADAAANKKGLTRAGLIRQAVLDWLARQPRPRKSA